MGLLSKLKGAIHAVTGGAATVTIEFPPQPVPRGTAVPVRVTATSTGPEVKSQGIYVDIRAVECIELPRNTASNDTKIEVETATYEHNVQIAPPFVLGANQTATFEAEVPIPTGAQPSYDGEHVRHVWSLRGRVDAVGNDPDSGFVPIQVGSG